VLYLNSSLIGTKTENYSFNPETSKFTREYVKKGFSRQNFKELEELSLGTYQFPTFPPKRNISFYEKHFQLDTRFIPWAFCMKPSEYKTQLINFAQGAIKELNKDPTTLSYYQNTFLPSNEVFGLLHPMKSCYKDTNPEGNKGAVVKSFLSKNEYLPITKYNRTTSITGRLKVEQGPEILLLKKEIRNKIFSMSSRFGQYGKIYELDYKSLEPRVLLSKTKPNKPIPEDIYEDIESTVFKNNSGLSRNTIKKVSLTLLYGGSEETLRDESTDSTRGLYVDVGVDELCEKINEYFGIEEFREKLIKENLENGFIRNEFGRKISTVNARNSILVNYWTQSTAIDIALKGFSSLCYSQKYSSCFLPLYVLTDALYVDIDERRWTQREIEDEVSFWCSKELFMDQDFPIGIKRITE
jgi:hypothetical protein